MDKKSNKKQVTSSNEQKKKILATQAVEFAVSKKEGHSCSSKEISHEAIAIRAYFISERRREKGLHGDCDSDWGEAEKQLRAESLR